MISATKALERLRQGNRRFVSNTRGPGPLPSHRRRAELAISQQQPIAIILGCSDSRVPPEIVFDQDLGDLFVIRVAGNVVAPSQLGSIEFAASWLGTRLVVVLGHSRCAAVLATVEALQRPTGSQSDNLLSIVDRIRHSVEPLLNTDLRQDSDTLVRQAVRANIGASVDRIRHGFKVLDRSIDDAGLVVVGAEYSLDTGVVEFFDDMEASSSCRDSDRE
ncbi:MAG: carbonic anhydrase, partial [Pirellulales bacterium]